MREKGNVRDIEYQKETERKRKTKCRKIDREREVCAWKGGEGRRGKRNSAMTCIRERKPW